MGVPDTTVLAPARAGRARQGLQNKPRSRVTMTATGSVHSSPASTVLRTYTHCLTGPPRHLLPRLQKKKMHLPGSPGGLAPEPVCPESPLLAAKFKSDSGSQISGGDRRDAGSRWLESCHFWGWGGVESLPEGDAGPELRGGTWRFWKKEAKAQRWDRAEPHLGGSAVLGAEGHE